MSIINATRMPNGLLAGGCLPRDTRLGADHDIYEERFKIYSRSEWPDLISANGQGLRDVVQKIKNQGQEGSCASNMTCQAFEIALVQALGKRAWLEFSPISIYRWLASNPNQGSTISGNLRQLRDVGVLPVRGSRATEALKAMGLSTSHTLTATGYYQTFPSGWKDTAKYFVGVEAFDIGSFEGIVSALLDGFPVGYGRAGHAICAVAPYQDGSRFGLDYANSWGNWGDQGFGKDTESFVSGAIKSYGAWALRTVLYSEELLKWVFA